MTRISNTISTLAPLAIVWAAWIAFGFWQDAAWPDHRRHVFGAVAVTASFLVLLPTIMLRRMHGWDWLTVSLAAAFGALSAVFFYIMAGTLWPLFIFKHRVNAIYAICIGLVVVLGWAMVMLLIAPDERGEYE